MRIHCKNLCGLPFIAAVLCGCVSVDPSADYERVNRLVEESNGPHRLYAPNDEPIVEREIASLLSDGLTSADAVKIALLNNPGLQAAFFEIGMARADVVQAGLLSNPVIGLSLRLPSGGGLANLDAGLTQNLAEIWLIPARKRAALRALDATILNVARRLGTAAVDARSTYFKVVAADRLADIVADNLKIAEQLADLTRIRREAGAGSSIDVNLSKAEVLEARLELRNAEQDAFEAQRDLAVLLGLSSDLREHKLVEDLPAPSRWGVSRDRLLAMAMDHRLDIRAAKAAVEAARENHRLELLRALPSVEIGVSLERAERSRSKGHDAAAEIVQNSLQGGSLSRPNASEDKDKNTDLIIGPSIGIELPIYHQNQAQIAKAEYAHRRAFKQYESLVRTVMQDARLAYEKARIASEVARFYKDDLLPLRQSNLDLLREAYRAGRANLVVVLDAQRSLIDARARYIVARRDATVTLTELEKTAGRPMAEILQSSLNGTAMLSGRAVPFGKGEVR